MSKRQTGSYIESGFGRSSRDSVSGKEGKRGEKTGSISKGKSSLVLEKGRFNTQSTLLGASRHKRYDRRDEELECLRRLVRDLELEARGWRHRRDCEERVKGYASVGGGYRETFH